MGNKKGAIGILTGGGDVPGLNPAIRAVTLRALKEGHQVIGIRNGWEGLISIDRSRRIDEQEKAQVLDAKAVRKLARMGGTFLHSSRTNPIKVAAEKVPESLRSRYHEKTNDLTDEVLKNIEYLGIDCLVPIGGDDTLSYGVHLHKKGIKVVAVPKTMDNDVPGTDYCLGFSTYCSRVIEFTHHLRTCAGSHERFLVIEVFGRYAGFTALLPTLSGAADRCLIPEYKFNIDHLTELMVDDKHNNTSKYSVVLVSEGAMAEGTGMVFLDQQTDAFGHKKLGGIGDAVSAHLKTLSAKYNNGEEIGVITQSLAYLARSGPPDGIDTLVAMAYGNIAMNLIEKGRYGRMACLRKGCYGDVNIEMVTSRKKVVNVQKFYDTERYRPKYENFEGQTIWIATSDED